MEPSIKRRRLTQSEVVDRMNGDAGSSDDLEIISVTKREASIRKLNHDLASASSSTEDAETSQRSDITPDNAGHSFTKKVEWSDDDAGVYDNFKNRKARKQKKVAANTRRAKKGASTGVGKKPRILASKKDEVKVYGAESDEDEELMDDALPVYLKDRRRAFDENRIELDQNGLRLPPSFEDIEFSDDERMDSLQEKPTFNHLKPCAPYEDITLPYSLGIIPASIAQWLREYQVQGTSFLHELFVYQKGGILGDDMGLGKTIQVIACLTAAFGKTGDERDAKRMRKMRRKDNRWYPKALIVCPGTLMENWKSEFQKWGWWNVDIYHGSTIEKENSLQAAKTGRLEVMITTYTTYRMNKSAINTVDWDCVIADECHIIKERRSEVTQAMNEINALCRIGLTGTAIQNKYDELWTLLNWTNPGRFGIISAWKAAISEPLKTGQAHDATVPQLAKARKTAKKLVQNLLPEFFLRRMKTLIADQLPKKSDRVVFCPLTDVQADAYENYVASDVVQCISRSTELCDCNSGKKRGWCCYMYLPETTTKWQNFVFPCIMTLQKLANHLALLIPSSSEDHDKQGKALANLQIAVPDRWRDLYRQQDSINNYAAVDFCGKWRILSKLLRFWHGSGDKVLVFSHSVRLLKMLQILFATKTSYNVSYLDGAMSYLDRAKAVDEFNSDPGQFVFLISTRAGGVGLNIVSANKVVVVDPNWNPSYDLQAQDRAYRIGQTRDVEVFRLVSAGTIEEIVYARQIYKQQQANIGYNASSERRYFKGVQGETDKKGEIFGLANLFAFQGDNVVMRGIVNKTNIAESKAGVQVVGLDFESSQDDEHDPLALRNDDDDPNSAMSQLAELIEKGGHSPNTKHTTRAPPKTDAVQAILAGAGVEYTHENSEVIGSSKIEARLSKRAEEAGNDIDMMDERVFGQSQSQSEEQLHRERHGLHDVAYKYKPPEDVRKRQFCTMAKQFGYADVAEFACVVEGLTQAQRRAWLDKFYGERRAKAEEVDVELEE